MALLGDPQRTPRRQAGLGAGPIPVAGHLEQVGTDGVDSGVPGQAGSASAVASSSRAASAPRSSLPSSATRRRSRQVTLATTEQPWGTWLGSTAGMVAVDAIAIVVGAVLGTRLPERAIKLFAAVAFAVFRVFLIAEGLGLV